MAKLLFISATSSPIGQRILQERLRQRGIPTEILDLSKPGGDTTELDTRQLRRMPRAAVESVIRRRLLAFGPRLDKARYIGLTFFEPPQVDVDPSLRRAHSAGDPPSQVEALNGPQEFIATMRAEFDKRRTFVVNELNTVPGMSCIMPNGAFHAFPNTAKIYGARFRDKTINSSADLALYFLEEAKVALVHGEAFGDDRYVRISYATSMDDIRKGIERIRQALQNLENRT